MAGPNIAGLDGLIARIAQHTTELHEASASPIQHYARGANDAYNLMLYLERKIEEAGAYPSVADRHTKRLAAVTIVMIVESFERFVKEVAALCIDHVAPLAVDDRLGKALAAVAPRTVAAHFAEKSVGRALTETRTWLNSKDVHDCVRWVLSDEDGNPWQPGLFPPKDQRARTLDTLFQLRHTIVHNVSVVTLSDAAKLQALTRLPVSGARIVAPTKSDVFYTKTFIDETARWCDAEIEKRLVAELEAFHGSSSSAFDPQAKANALAMQFGRPVTLLGKSGIA